MRRHRQIALLGFPGVGKSSLAHHFVYKQFYNEYDPNIKTNLQYQCMVDDSEYELMIVDNAGSDQYTVDHSDFDTSDVYIIIYAIDDRQSFEMVSKIREKILSTSAITRIPIVLVGNKTDRTEERVVSTEEGRSLADEWNVHFVEASAKNLEAVKKLFEKSIYAMNSIDPLDGLNEQSAKDIQNCDTKNASSLFRNGFMRKSFASFSSKETSSKQKCNIS